MKKIFLLMIVVFQFLSFSTRADSLKVDSICNLIEGEWYFSKTCGGLLPECTMTTLLVKQTITRIAGTDSVILVGQVNGNFKIVFEANPEWAIVDMYYLYRGGATVYNITVENKFLQIGSVCYDCLMDMFSRENPLSLPNASNAAENIELTFAPNPTKSSFLIAGVSNIEHLSILDYRGALLVSNVCNASLNEIVDVSNLLAGIYFVQVISGGRIYTGKIAKQ